VFFTHCSTIGSRSVAEYIFATRWAIHLLMVQQVFSTDPKTQFEPKTTTYASGVPNRKRFGSSFRYGRGDTLEIRRRTYCDRTRRNIFITMRSTTGRQSPKITPASKFASSQVDFDPSFRTECWYSQLGDGDRLENSVMRFVIFRSDTLGVL